MVSSWRKRILDKRLTEIGLVSACATLRRCSTGPVDIERYQIFFSNLPSNCICLVNADTLPVHYRNVQQELAARQQWLIHLIPFKVAWMFFNVLFQKIASFFPWPAQV